MINGKKSVHRFIVDQMAKVGVGEEAKDPDNHMTLHANIPLSSVLYRTFFHAFFYFLFDHL